ncbi:phage protease [Chondromyces crocatus]|uniref:Mu-like prophage I protein n=1 Tax=Chondromyces crocatus TaxID=52 RepID=A0A0K1EBJ9_CHOCO|nr:phage protease [Chondromyces crocatus]AKT38261.1 uncharacterized protein CMC5_024040 [Chondromyces crocatus]
MRTRAYVFQPKDPPAEIQLWSVGPNPTDYGTHHWTERSVREVTEVYETRGNPLQIDIEHNGAADEREQRSSDDPPPTGGYAFLEIRAGAPWLRFDWSAYAVEQVRSRQRLFLSPEYDVDPDTGEITRLVRISLVGDPGTHHARMLASAKRVRAQHERNERVTEVLTMILATIEAALGADDPETAKEILSKLKAELEGGGTSEPDSQGEAVEAEGDPSANSGERDEEEKPVATTTKARTKATTGNIDLAVRVAELERHVARAEVERLVDQHKDRFTASTRAWALTQPLPTVQGFIKAASKQALRAPVTAAATRGEGQGSSGKQAGDEAINEELDRALGVRRPASGEFGFADKPIQGLYRLNAPTAAQIRAQRRG